MPEAYIVDALRSPVGRRKGSLAQIHGADLGARAIKALVARNNIPADDYDDVIWGCLDQIGPLAANVARTTALVAGLPEHVPGVTIERQCGSSQQAVHFAAQAVMSGTQDVLIAGGVQTMSQIPIQTSIHCGGQLGLAEPYLGSSGWRERYGDQEISQFRGAELIAEKWHISRRDMEEFALESHRRAVNAIDNGYFDKEVLAMPELKMDETARRDTSLEKMATLEPIRPNGRITAGVSSQVSDGTSAMLIVSEKALKRYNLTPRARIHAMAVYGADPVFMLTAPIPATAYALKRAGMTWGDIDLVEINEAFASVVLAWFKETGYSPEKTNVNGGAIALGHPLGATGTKLMTTLLHELERRKLRYGMQTMCEGGGVANVTIIERL
jgi:acetyl-CoA C-acetyltransferase